MEQQSTQEQEMREFFNNAISAMSTLRDRSISAFVDYSRQARELTELRERLDRLNERMASVVNEAQSIRQDLHVVIVERDKYKRDAEDNLALAQGYEKERDEAKLNHSQTVEKLNAVESDLKAANSNLNQVNGQNERLRSDLEWSQNSAKRYRDERDASREELNKANQALKEANERLARLQGTFRDIFPEAPKQLVEEAKPVEVPQAEPHPVQATEFSPVNERIDQPTEDSRPWWEKENKSA